MRIISSWAHLFYEAERETVRRIGEEQASVGEIEKVEETEITIASEELIGSIRPLIEQARAHVAQSVNSELVLLYWQIGKRI